MRMNLPHPKSIRLSRESHEVFFVTLEVLSYKQYGEDIGASHMSAPNIEWAIYDASVPTDRDYHNFYAGTKAQCEAWVNVNPIQEFFRENFELTYIIDD